MMLKSYGIKVDTKGAYVFGPEHNASTRREAAEHRNLILSEKTLGNVGVYAAAVTFFGGSVYRRQTIPGALA